METKELLSEFNCSWNKTKELKKECQERIKEIREKYAESIDALQNRQNDIFEKIVKDLISEYGSLQEDGSRVIKFKHDPKEKFAEFEIEDTEPEIGYCYNSKKFNYIITEIICNDSSKLYVKFYRNSINGYTSEVRYLISYFSGYYHDFLNKLYNILTGR